MPAKLKYDFIKLPLNGYSCSPNYKGMTQYNITIEAFHKQRKHGCVLVYRYTKERNINELRHNSMYGCENNRNSPMYRYTRTAPKA